MNSKRKSECNLIMHAIVIVHTMAGMNNNNIIYNYIIIELLIIFFNTDMGLIEVEYTLHNTSHAWWALSEEIALRAGDGNER